MPDVKYELSMTNKFLLFFFFRIKACKLTKKKKIERKIYNYCLQNYHK